VVRYARLLDGVRDKFWACENVTGLSCLGKAIPVPQVRTHSGHHAKMIVTVAASLNLEKRLSM
jgi:hypothetical protein